jgi:hypothetical protein
MILEWWESQGCPPITVPDRLVQISKGVHFKPLTVEAEAQAEMSAQGIPQTPENVKKARQDVAKRRKGALAEKKKLEKDFPQFAEAVKREAIAQNKFAEQIAELVMRKLSGEKPARISRSQGAS